MRHSKNGIVRLLKFLSFELLKMNFEQELTLDIEFDILDIKQR